MKKTITNNTTQQEVATTPETTQHDNDISPIKKIDAEKKYIIVEGILSQNIDKAGYKGKGAEKRNISIKMSRPLNEDEREAIAILCNADRNDKYCPHPINEKKEYFTVKTSFTVPVRQRTNTGYWNELTLDEVGLGSEVGLACRLKDNAIYPLAMTVNKLVEFDPFAFFD